MSNSTPGAGGGTPSRRPLRVLIADDEPVLVRAFERLLGLRGHEVHGVASATEALDLAGRVSFDVAVVDLRMPGGGRTVVEGLEAGAFAGRMILMTGEVPPPDWMEGRGELLAKPFPIREAVELVERAATETPEDEPEEVLLARAGWAATLDRILVGISHDLNSQVSSLGGLVELQALGDEDATEAAAHLKKEVRNLEEVVRSLSWICRGTTSPPPELVAPRELLERVVVLHARARGSHAVETRLDVHPGAPALRVARERLLRSMLILLGRVAGSASGPGRVALRVDAGPDEEGALRVTIARDGEPEPAPPEPREGGAAAWGTRPRGGPASRGLEPASGGDDALARLIALDGGATEWGPVSVTVSFRPHRPA